MGKDIDEKDQVNERYDFVCALIASAVSPLLIIFSLGRPKITFWCLFWYLISIIGGVFLIRLILSGLKPRVLSLLAKSAKNQ